MQIFTGFRCLEKETKLQGWGQTGEDQQRSIYFADATAETGQTLETVTSPANTLTASQSARPGTNIDETTTRSMDGVPQEVFQLEGSVNLGDTDINVHLEDKLQSLSEVKYKYQWK